MARGLSLTENAIKQIDGQNVLQGKNEREREFEQSQMLNKICGSLKINLGQYLTVKVRKLN